MSESLLQELDALRRQNAELENQVAALTQCLTVPDISQPQAKFLDIPALDGGEPGSSFQTTLPLWQKAGFLQSIWNGVDYGIFVLEVLNQGEDFRFIVGNPAVERSSPIPFADLLGQTVSVALGEQASYYLERYRQCIRTGKTLQFEKRFDHLDEPSWWLLSVTPLRDAQQQIYQLVVTTTDISDRIKAEMALRQSEQRFRDISEAAGEYIWEINAEGKYTFVTDKVKHVKGYEPDQLLGRSLLEFLHPEDIGQVNETLQFASACKSPFKLELRDLTPTGEIVWEEVNGVPLLDDHGAVIGFRGAGLSISDRKQAEAQLRQQAADLQATLFELQHTQAQLVQAEKMSSLGQLVAGVAHEINNPVNFIYGNLSHASAYVSDLLYLINLYRQHYPTTHPAIQAALEAIDLDFVATDLPKVLASMKLGSERIQKIVASLRTFSRMDEAEYKAVDIHEGIDSTLLILQSRIKANGSRPAVEIVKEYGQLPLVECFAGQLNQVFMNILSNALDALEERDEHRTAEAMQQNPSKILIRTEITERQWVKICIADNGRGISETVQHRLFDPFFTTKPVGKGTGMGLSISYQIVTDRHGGRLSYQTGPDQGTQFIIEIPLRQT